MCVSLVSFSPVGRRGEGSVRDDMRRSSDLV